MPTTVHIPPALLARLDRRAREENVSRNSVIVRAIERELTPASGWPPGFLERLKTPPDPEMAAAVDEMLEHIRRNRRSKPAPRL